MVDIRLRGVGGQLVMDEEKSLLLIHMLAMDFAFRLTLVAGLVGS